MQEEHLNVGRSVLGCIAADLCKELFIVQHVSRSTRSQNVFKAPGLKMSATFRRNVGIDPSYL